MSARLPQVPVEHGTVRLVGAMIIDGVSDEPLENGELEFRDGVITYVGPQRSHAVNGTKTVDLTGGTITPGFIDLHVHMAMPNDVDDSVIRWWFPEEEHFATANSLRQTLEAGVTSARDLSGLTPGFRNAIARGWIDGPRMHLSVSMLSPTGGHADPVAPNGALPVYAQRATTPGWVVADTDEEIVKAVRRLDMIGADVIKICTTGGLSTDFDSAAALGVPCEQIELIGRTVKRLRNQPIAAHSQSREGTWEAVRGGVTTVEHAFGIDNDALLAEILKRGTIIVPTLSVLNRISPKRYPTPDAVARRRQRIKEGMYAISKAIRAGVRIAAGTDSGITRHGSNLTELGYLVDAGMTPLQAIHAATAVGAEAMGLSGLIGTLETGKMADIVLSDVDPSTSEGIHAIADSRHIRAVWQSGRIVKDLDGLAR